MARYYTVTPVLEEIPTIPEEAPRRGRKKALPPPLSRVVDLVWSQNDLRKERSTLSGAYVIETDHTEKTSSETWSLYTTLTRVEGAFRDLKSDLGIRPVFHQKPERCRGHLFVSILAYFLLSTIEYRLRARGETRSWPTVRQALSTLCRMTVTGNDPHTGFDYRIRMTGKPEPDQKDLLEKLGIRNFLRRIVSRVRSGKSEKESSEGAST